MSAITFERMAELRGMSEVVLRMESRDGELLEILNLAGWALDQKQKAAERLARHRGKDSGGAPKVAGKAVSVQKKAHQAKTAKDQRSILDTPPIPAAVQEVVRRMEQPEVRRPIAFGTTFMSLGGPMKTDLTRPQLKPTKKK